METKVIDFWVKVLCEHNVGSCSYSVCSNKTEVYPQFFENYMASKQCPAVPPATYSVSNLVMDVTKSLPSILDGEFRMNIDFDSSYAGHIACLHLDVNLKS
jgi:hypothetical protein